ncbi:hypothetical protein ACHAWF_013953 [Thalassiosira exigua]
MAAKQGLTAQIHQYSEDTKRSLLSRAPAGIKSHSWLSNLNTTCTIKSAPPRTPEVMSMLGTKCGWLAKRNEQHVWQKRWCCVVPHTFLYYFEASPVEVSKGGGGGIAGGGGDDDGDGGGGGGGEGAWSGGGINVAAFATLDQEALNLAVREGYDDGPAGAGGGGRMSLYGSLPTLMGGGGGGGGGGHNHNHNHSPDAHGEENAVAWDPDTGTMNPLSPSNPDGPAGGGGDGIAAPGGTYRFAPTAANLQPVGIIDLECYSAVNRSKLNPTVLELAGDAVTNPDLRSFYFQSPGVEDADSWTRALLGDRHQSLKDETEAYRQVCDSFPLQLANCSSMIDAAEARAEDAEREAYAARSRGEEGRRRAVAAVREVLEQRFWETEASKKRNALQERGRGKNGVKGPFGETHPGSNGGKETIDGSGSGGGEANGGSGNKGLVDASLDAHYETLESHRLERLRELEASLSSPAAAATSDVVPPVRTLADYASRVFASFDDLRSQLRTHEAALGASTREDRSQLEALRSAVEGGRARSEDAERRHAAQSSDLKRELDASRRRCDELAKQVEAQRMEFSMYQSATKGKLGELQQHKKILKREVIDLRKRVDESGSEHTAAAHECEKVKAEMRATKERNATLERYIDRLEKQVGVQQNMMEMMSQHGDPSFVGKVVGPGVTQSDSKDAVSLSGMSMGSQYRRLNSSSMSLGRTGTPNQDRHEMKSTGHASLKPRTLLPPEFPPEPRGSRGDRDVPRSLHDVSPLPTPRVFQVDGGGGAGELKPKLEAAVTSAFPHLGDDDARDASTAYHRSETSQEISPGSGDGGAGGGGPAAKDRTPGRRKEASESAGAPQVLSDDPILSNRSGEEGCADPAPTGSPRTPKGDDAGNGESRTPVRDNSFLSDSERSSEDEDPFDGVDDEDGQDIDDVPAAPTMDSDAALTLNVNASKEREDFPFPRNPQLRVEAGGADEGDLGDDDDDASRVSDITEDRTQRQIDDDLAERRKILLAYVNKAKDGVANAVAVAGSSESASQSQGPSLGPSVRRRLETIENMLPSGEDQSRSTAGGGASRRSLGKLSVAQRARLAADDRSNAHRSPSPSSRAEGDAGSASSSQNRFGGGFFRGGSSDQASSSRGSSAAPQRATSAGSPALAAPRGGGEGGATTSGSRSATPSRAPAPFSPPAPAPAPSLGKSGSFFERMGKAIEKAVDNSVLGVGTHSMDDGDSSYYDETESEVISSVVSDTSTTLQERIAKQRERQLAFLKNKGLLEDEASMQGGAGGGGSSSGSVAGSQGGSPMRSGTPRRPGLRATGSFGRSR